MDVIQKRGLAESSEVTGLSNQLEIVSRQIADLRGMYFNRLFTKFYMYFINIIK